MKKAILIMVFMLLINSVVVFAAEDTKATFRELKNLEKIHKISYEIVDPESLDKNVDVQNLTIDEIEALILEIRNNNVVINETIYKEETIDVLNIENEQYATTASIVNGAKYLSSNHDAGDLEYKDAVSVAYQYEVVFLPGEPDITKNWRFTAADSGGITNLNPSWCRIYNVTSSAFVSSTTMVTHNYTFKYELGLFTEIAGLPVWIVVKPGIAESSSNYSIYQVK